MASPSLRTATTSIYAPRGARRERRRLALTIAAIDEIPYHPELPFRATALSPMSQTVAQAYLRLADKLGNFVSAFEVDSRH